MIDGVKDCIANKILVADSDDVYDRRRPMSREGGGVSLVGDVGAKVGEAFSASMYRAFEWWSEFCLGVRVAKWESPSSLKVDWRNSSR